jgi:ubiquinone/menaquinone biosynthesis C-methylase UbiE
MINMSFRAFLAQQLGHPQGVWGQILVRLLNHSNAEMNDLTLRQLSLEPQDHILEIGFGGGDLIQKLLSTNLPDLVAGIDFSTEALKHCERRFRRSIQLNLVELHQANGQDIPYPEATFSKVCTVNTIYFWPNPSQIISECVRVMKNHSILGICYNSKAFLEQAKLLQHGFTAYEFCEVEALMRQAGLTEISTVSDQSSGNGDFFCTTGRIVCARHLTANDSSQ